MNPVFSKYEYLDKPYAEFVNRLEYCVNRDEKTWFNCLKEFSGESEIEFKWNEFELMSLEAAEGDEEWVNDIKLFWKENLPIIMSVVNGYSYYALRNDGKIVSGFEPEFEETEVVADSFFDFLEKVMNSEINF